MHRFVTSPYKTMPCRTTSATDGATPSTTRSTATGTAETAVPRRYPVARCGRSLPTVLRNVSVETPTRSERIEAPALLTFCARKSCYGTNSDSSCCSSVPSSTRRWDDGGPANGTFKPPESAAFWALPVVVHARIRTLTRSKSWHERE